MIVPADDGLGLVQVPGDPFLLRALAAQLGSLAEQLDEVRSGLSGLESVKWEGEAAQAFKGVMHQQPVRYAEAAESLTMAAGAITAYSAVLEDAQLLAARAGDLELDAQAVTARWQATPPVPAAASGTDPGDVIRLMAQQINAGAAADLAAATSALVEILHAAEADAPCRPGLFHELVTDGWHYSMVLPAHVLLGFGDGTWGIVDGAYQLGSVAAEASNPMIWAFDPDGRKHADRVLGEFASDAWHHPVAVAKAAGEAMLDWQEWAKDPARAVGEELPTVLLTLATAGGAAAARATTAARGADALEEIFVADSPSGVLESRTAAVGDDLPSPIVSDAKLQRIVNDLYKGTDNPDRLGTGTTADAVRAEILTNEPTGGRFHFEKAYQYSLALTKRLKTDLTLHDRIVAQSLLDDLRDALGDGG